MYRLGDDNKFIHDNVYTGAGYGKTIKMNLALFDFDGTISEKDSFAGFIFYSVGKIKLMAGIFFLIPILFAFKLKLISNWKAKEIFLIFFYKGWSEEYFFKIASEYSNKIIPSIVRDIAIDRIKFHKSHGDKIVVVSASVESWLKDWCKNNEIELIGTKLEIKNSKLTGKMLTKNCHGLEKVNRIKEKYNLEDFKYIYAYGDSSGDTEMLNIANEKYYRWKRIDD